MHRIFYKRQKGGGESATAVYGLGQGIFFFPSICYRQSQITFFIVEHICKINLVDYLTTMNVNNHV